MREHMIIEKKERDNYTRLSFVEGQVGCGSILLSHELSIAFLEALNRGKSNGWVLEIKDLK